jgi:hypothetical protein
MPSFAELGKMLGEAGKSLFEPAVPELAERGTAAAPALLEKLKTAEPPIAQRPAQPQVTSMPEVERHLEMTYNPQQSLGDGIQAFKTFLGGAIKRDPNLPKDIQERFLKARQSEESAGYLADQELSKMLEPMQSDPVTQTTIWAKHLLASDELAQAIRDGRQDIMGRPIDEWKRVVSELQAKVDADPEITEAHGRYRAKMDALFGDAMGRGWLAPDRYLDDYTPIRKLHAVADASASAAGEDFQLNLLSMLQHRGGAEGERESNLVKMLRETMSQYHRHVAEHELWMDLTSDPTIDLTDRIPPFVDPPKGFGRYRPGPGAIGYDRKSSPEQFMDGAQDALPSLKTGRVLPSPIIEALESYKRSMHTTRENQWYKIGNAMARQFTIYNPGNTNVNRGSDLLVALTRAPEMGVSPMGILRWYGTANKVAFRGVFGKGNTIVNLNGQPVDLWEMTVEQGLPANTIMHDVGGIGVPQQFLRNLPEAQRNYDNWWQNLVTRYGQPQQIIAAERQAVELAPRIAAGIDAYLKSGDPNEFGRVGREITFHYGAGAPRWATFPALRLVAPFIQFNGLASEWILNTMNLKTNTAAKVKALAAMVVVPTTVMMWNAQNPAYQQVENALHERERNQMHIIVPDPMNPAEPRRDINGAPVVLRFRWWVPEQVAQLAGLGNMPQRIERMATGRDTPMQFIEEAGRQAGESFTGMLLTPEVVNELLTGKTDTGRVMNMRERLMRLSPLARIGIEGATAAQDYGPAEGARVAAERWLGLSFAPTLRRSTKLLDAQFRDAKTARDRAKALLVTAIRNGTPQQVRDAWTALQKQQTELARLAPLARQERDTAPEAPASPEVRQSAIEKELERIRSERDKESQ